jgi:hypothetical protein
MRTGLVLPYMLGLDVISFSISMFLLFFCLICFQQKKKKKKKRKKNIGGEDAELYFFLLIAFQILHVFLPDISVC